MSSERPPERSVDDGGTPEEQPGYVAEEPADPEESVRATDGEVAKLEDQLRRTAADLDNLRKRYGRDLQRERSAERARITADWLPVVDNLERALQYVPGEDFATESEGEADSDPVAQGVRAVYEQAVATMGRLGFPRFDPVGEAFDPVLHEAISTVHDENAAEGTVVAVIQPGYGTAEALLRPAGVVVATR